MEVSRRRGLVSCLLFACLILGGFHAVSNAADEQKADVASVYITSEDPVNHGRAWIETSREHKTSGTIKMIREDGDIIYDGKLKQIKGRGNSTWGDPKKPYQIKLDKDTDLCETGLEDEANKTWVLLSGYKDRTLMRNQLTFAIAREMGLDYTPHCRQVDLYYDGEYRGLYLLCEKTEVGKGRIDITNLEKQIEKANPDCSPDEQPVKTGLTDRGLICQTVQNLVMPDLDGGYLLEMDYEVRAREEASWFQTLNNQYIVVESPEYLPLSGMNSISDLYQTMENAVYHGGVDPRTGKDYRELVDLESLAKMYLIEELSQDIDAYKSSQYFYKPEGEDKLYAGPVWDFDLAYGDEATYGKLAGPYGFYAGQHALGKRLLMIPSFQEEVKRVYREQLYDIVKNIPEQMSEWSDAYKKSFLRNSELWPDNTTGDGTESCRSLEEFLLDRNEYLYQEIMEWDGTKVNYEGSFVDVSMSDWYYQDVRYTARHSLMKGMGEGLFCPQEDMNRAMIVKVLYRIAGSPEVSSESTFTDVQPDMWYSSAIAWAEENGITQGIGDGLFGINDSVTREDFVTLINRYQGFPEGEADLSVYRDEADVDEYAVNAFRWAVEKGIIRGDDKNALLPGGSLTRAQAAAIIHRLSEMGIDEESET